ncbi:MAG: hypothetical protein LC795_22270 [Acidobacteria bacterium]|nr:hypothetical protein [Acidobacteriota bacterium]
MSFTNQLNEAVHQVLQEYNLTYLKLEDEITIPDLRDQVPIKLAIDSGPENADLLSGPKSIHLLIDLPAIIASGEPITTETFKQQIVTQLGALGITPKHIFATQIAFPVLGENGETVIIGIRGNTGEEIILELPISGAQFIIGELRKLLTDSEVSDEA